MVTQPTAEAIEHSYIIHILHAESVSMSLAQIYASLEDSRKLLTTLSEQKDRKNDIWS